MALKPAFQSRWSPVFPWLAMRIKPLGALIALISSRNRCVLLLCRLWWTLWEYWPLKMIMASINVTLLARINYCFSVLYSFLLLINWLRNRLILELGMCVSVCVVSMFEWERIPWWLQRSWNFFRKAGTNLPISVDRSQSSVQFSTFWNIFFSWGQGRLSLKLICIFIFIFLQVLLIANTYSLGWCAHFVTSHFL